jgi:hypothetical protein
VITRTLFCSVVSRENLRSQSKSRIGYDRNNWKALANFFSLGCDGIDLSELTGFEVIDFGAIATVECPCGVARRALLDEPSVPYSLHITEISLDAQSHYHLKTTETYLILDCQPDARLEINGHLVPVRPFTAIVIHPEARHRAVGKMKVAIIASPKFDPHDEWLD